MLIGFDLGQGALKATALDPSGTVLAAVAEPYPTMRPRPGWAEQDPGDWLAALAAASQSILAQTRTTRVTAIALTSATHHAVLLDDTNAVLRPCILLSDGRAADHAARLAESHDELIQTRTRNQPAAGWTLPQLQWVAEQEPAVWENLRRVALAKDFLVWHLTGEWASDWIDAEGTLLVDSADHSWDTDLCRLAGLDLSVFNPLASPTDVVGNVSGAGAALTGLPPGTPVVAGSSDTSAELLAAGATRSGQVVVKLATAGMVAAVSPAAIGRPGWFTYSYVIDGLDYQALGTNSAAEAFRWFTELFPGASYAELEAEAGRVPPGAGGVLFHPYLMGERSPYFDPDLRASFVGVGADHDRSHLARAVMEGVGLSLLDCLLTMRKHLGVEREGFVVGGGARSPLWRSIVADALGMELSYPALADASAGAALIAGAGVGKLETLDGQWAQTADRVAPDAARHDGYMQMLDIYRDTGAKLSDVGPRLRGVEFT